MDSSDGFDDPGGEMPPEYDFDYREAKPNRFAFLEVDAVPNLEVAAVKLFQERTVSLGKAAELANQPVERFLEMLAAAGVPAVSYDPAELDNEVTTFT